jgi:hypothetical protein
MSAATQTNKKMLEKYTKYAATALAVASLSTFMIGCSSETETGSDYVPPADESPEEEGPIEGDEE